MRFLSPVSILSLNLALVLPALAQTPPGAQPPAKLEAMNVESGPVPGESEFVGTYHQPEWTARRPFAMTSVYVQPAWQAEVETAYDGAKYSAQPAQHQFYQEVELGLPYRFQLSLENYYQNFREDQPTRSGWHEDNATVGFRYAFADWGALPLNPAAGVAWKAISGVPDAAEYHLVLGNELTPLWHWAANLAYERQWGGQRLRDTTLTSGLTYTVFNERLNVGLEARGRRSADGRDPATKQLTLGPCVQIRPSDLLHVDLVPMWGIGKKSPAREIVLIVGFEFGEGSADHDDAPRTNVKKAGQ